eukprot:1597123-Rhodomonas_salina.2
MTRRRLTRCRSRLWDSWQGASVAWAAACNGHLACLRFALDNGCDLHTTPTSGSWEVRSAAPSPALFSTLNSQPSTLNLHKFQPPTSHRDLVHELAFASTHGREAELRSWAGWLQQKGANIAWIAAYGEHKDCLDLVAKRGADLTASPTCRKYAVSVGLSADACSQ